MPVSNTSDLVERRSKDGGALWTERHSTFSGARLAVDRIAEHVEHPGQDGTADRRLQRPAGIDDDHSTRQTLRRCQGDATHVVGVALRQHLDDDGLGRGDVQHRIDRRQLLVEADVDDAAANGRDHADVRHVGANLLDRVGGCLCAMFSHRLELPTCRPRSGILPPMVGLKIWGMAGLAQASRMPVGDS